jgi:hypothetical protein
MSERTTNTDTTARFMRRMLVPGPVELPGRCPLQVLTMEARPAGMTDDHVVESFLRLFRSVHETDEDTTHAWQVLHALTWSTDR